MSKKQRRRAAKGNAPAEITGRLSASEAADIAAIAGQLTVGDIAAMLMPIAPGLEGTIQRIRHWTREGVLRPIELAHGGPGKHRRYDDASVYSAAVLTVMADLGLPVSQSRFLANAMEVVNSESAKWMAARKKGETVRLPPLIIGVATGNTIQVGLGKLRDERNFKVTNVVLKLDIDLTKLFAEVDHGRS
jgi:DNA-binding transcriptional MerR regulator